MPARLRSIPLIAISLFAVSCATITTGRYEEIRVTSSPSQAMATLLCGGNPSGEGPTPATFKIRRNAGDCVLTLRKDGFEEKTVAIEQGVNPAYWANMIFTPVPMVGGYASFSSSASDKAVDLGLIGAAVAIFGGDFWTGAVHAHKPPNIDAVLKPK